MLKLTNAQIYHYALKLNSLQGSLILPVKANFYIHKNINTLFSLAQEIETERKRIESEYANDENAYDIAIQELSDIEQDVKIYKIKIEELKDTSLSLEQMDALMFMIEEEDEEKE